MKQRFGIIFSLFLTGQLLAAAPDMHEAQIDAATDDAVWRLRADLEAQSLSPGLSVGDFLRQTGSAEQLCQVLRRGDQIGGPRWIDSETCQVKLAISSQRVRETLTKIAQDNSRLSPLPADAIQAKLMVWNNRTFTATGTSISAARAQQLRPSEVLWRDVKPDVCRQTIIEARDHAIDRVLASLKPIDIGDEKKLAVVLNEKSVSDSLRKWFAARPVTRVEFNNDLSVEITLSASARDVFDAMLTAAGAAQSDWLTKDSLKLAKIRREFDHVMSPAVGLARVPGSGKGGVVALKMPRTPPAWLDQPLANEATARPMGTRLKTARSAEDSARDLLRAKIDSLELASTSIGEAAKRDPAIERAVQQSLARARADKIDYQADGSATVKLVLDPHDLWDELRELP